MSALDELATAVGGVAERVAPAVVSIGGGWRGGSGIVIAPGLVLTNAHNVHHDEVPVAFADGRTASARVAGVDADGDLAVVQVDTGEVSPLEWAAEGSVAIGTPVLAVTGTPNGPRVTLGIVSSAARAFRGPRGRRISGSIEHTAPMARGSSGSALVDATGRLVGINTNRVGDGFYLAIPTDGALRTRVDSLGRGEAQERPQLGVAVAPAHVARRLRRSVGLADRDGLLVRDVGDGTPAAAAGIRPGDLLVEAAGRPLASVDDLFDALGTAGAGDPLELRVVRGAEELSVSVDLAARGGSDEGLHGGEDAGGQADPGTPVH
ncbi:MAG: trypsin-like peptidase domain-containing protein [Chloroflexi bacterium]|nr:trypsin-like peptidase domain-containing protein [Chloroflexota bacterium]